MRASRAMSTDASAFRAAAFGVELHAHVNGCVRPSTLSELARERGLEEECARALRGERELMMCFEIFKLAHECCSSARAIRRITREAVEDFFADGARYVELRTTPKDVPERGLDKETYVCAVLDGLQDACGTRGGGNGENGTNVARIILSVDRGRDDSREKVMRTIDLAVKYAGEGVVGVDLSGAPNRGDWDTYEEALEKARRSGLGVALHCGEIRGTADEERRMLEFKPDRLGHCVFTVRDDELYKKLLESNILVELCLTSNVLTKSNPSYADHHFAKLYRDGAPVCLCTDDTWVFNTCLSREYEIACETFGLTMRDIHAMNVRAMDFAFCDDEVKTNVLARIRSVQLAKLAT